MENFWGWVLNFFESMQKRSETFETKLQPMYIYWITKAPGFFWRETWATLGWFNLPIHSLQTPNLFMGNILESKVNAIFFFKHPWFKGTTGCLRVFRDIKVILEVLNLNFPNLFWHMCWGLISTRRVWEVPIREPGNGVLIRLLPTPTIPNLTHLIPPRSTF